MPNISQGGIALRLRCGGVFSGEFIKNLLPVPTVNEFKCRSVFIEVTGNF